MIKDSLMECSVCKNITSMKDDHCNYCDADIYKMVCPHCKQNTPIVVDYCAYCFTGIDDEYIKNAIEEHNAKMEKSDNTNTNFVTAIGLLVGLFVLIGGFLITLDFSDSDSGSSYRGSRQEKKDFIEWQFERSREEEQERIEEELFDDWDLR